MSLLFESIACLNGQLQNLSRHQERVNRSRAEVMGMGDLLELASISVPENCQSGLWKCRVSYGESIGKVDFSAYRSSEPQTFKLVEADIQYPYKFEDRQKLNQLFERRGSADDIIIVVDGQITDSSYGNLVFFNGKKWLTPEAPLLPGTMRATLLDEGKIKTAKLSLSDLHTFTRFIMINALNPFEDNRTLPIANVLT